MLEKRKWELDRLSEKHSRTFEILNELNDTDSGYSKEPGKRHIWKARPRGLPASDCDPWEIVAVYQLHIRLLDIEKYSGYFLSQAHGDPYYGPYDSLNSYCLGLPKVEGRDAFPCPSGVEEPTDEGSCPLLFPTFEKLEKHLKSGVLMCGFPTLQIVGDDIMEVDGSMMCTMHFQSAQDLSFHRFTHKKHAGVIPKKADQPTDHCKDGYKALAFTARFLHPNLLISQASIDSEQLGLSHDYSVQRIPFVAMADQPSQVPKPVPSGKSGRPNPGPQTKKGSLDHILNSASGGSSSKERREKERHVPYRVSDSQKQEAPLPPQNDVDAVLSDNHAISLQVGSLHSNSSSTPPFNGYEPAPAWNPTAHRTDPRYISATVFVLPKFYNGVPSTRISINAVCGQRAALLWKPEPNFLSNQSTAKEVKEYYQGLEEQLYPGRDHLNLGYPLVEEEHEFFAIPMRSRELHGPSTVTIANGVMVPIFHCSETRCTSVLTLDTWRAHMDGQMVCGWPKLNPLTLQETGELCKWHTGLGNRSGLSSHRSRNDYHVGRQNSAKQGLDIE
ncbi:hypothetical protein BJ508DRAFT_362562 [Ascobolus immersus RN42]|uniref:Uncharacterized protein n=1 Tax=Ascobolus immersus RN42 TaxID=1160509 RepID=A0A3N4I385_ASCIM|nr:hypothetical protein BJ508DRAFT_362562 [Ascobolus immersus RN42]